MSALPQHTDRVLDLEPLSVDSTSRPLDLAQAVITSTAATLSGGAVVATPAVDAAAGS